MKERSNAIRRAVLLAAGRGTRLAPLTERTPKCLLPINGRALLDLQLEALAAVGVDDVTIVAGFMADAVARHVGDRCRVIVNPQFATTGSIASLALAVPHLRGHGFILQNADTLYPADLIRRLRAAPHENVCLIDSAMPFRPGEYHVETGDGRIVQYSNELSSDQSAGESAQLLRVGQADSAAFLDRVEQLASVAGSKGFPNQAYDVLMDGDGLWPVFTAGLPWWEVDTADDLARCSAGNLAGMKVAPPTSELQPISVKSAAARVAGLVKSPCMPYRLRWLPRSIGPLCRHPARVAREVYRFQTRRLSLPGLDLILNGPRLLQVALAEAQSLGINPFLLWGSLLGCVRDGGFIRGDQDIDLGIMECDARRLADFRFRMQSHGFVVRIVNDHKLSLVHPRHPRLFIDVDVVRPHRDGWAITNSDADVLKIFHYHFPAAVFASTRPVKFGTNLKVRIPADPYGFLAHVYGDWRTPAAKVDFRYGPLNTEVELVDAAKIETMPQLCRTS